MTEPTEHTDVDHLQDFHVRALDLATMFKAIARISDGELGKEDFEITLVAKQGERMAHELSDDIDRLSLGLPKQKREEVTQ